MKMKGQSQSKKNSQERGWDVYRYMVLCVSLGLRFTYIKNYQNKALNIVLSRQKTLCLDFAKWKSELERAVIYENDVQIQIRLVDVPEVITSEGNREAVEIPKQIKNWLAILYKGDISFQYSQGKLIVGAQEDSWGKDFEFTIGFSKAGEVIDACCKFDGENYHFIYGVSLEWTLYRFLDEAKKRHNPDNGLVS